MPWFVPQGQVMAHRQIDYDNVNFLRYVMKLSAGVTSMAQDVTSRMSAQSFPAPPRSRTQAFPATDESLNGA